MRKLTQQVSKLFLQHTPAYTRPVVQKNIKQSKLHEIKDDKKLQPMICYIQALQKHKEYLDFFEIGVVRDQRKKIENVAKYVGLAIKDYTQDHHEHQRKMKHNKEHKQHGKQDLSKHSELIQNWGKDTTAKQPQVAHLHLKQSHKQGHKQSHKQGHKQPHKQGHKQSHKQGHKQGHKQSHKQGHKQPHKQGHKQSHKQGHKQGHKQSHKEGHKQETAKSKAKHTK